MKDIIHKVAQKYNLNLIEQCILYDLEKKYPQTVSIEELEPREDEYSLFESNMENLKEKGLIEQRFHKYRLMKTKKE
ncbi:hypothetical protein SAMN04488072_10718 [Lentibacillus halodurans]|uniref:Uncharacterized protein n=1 Tax=Lentibacillus halodurans TaxID=237679 RepID=A0A1I0YB22_9BACI|nr:hypothetical protein [Lentibacillus halodurans]SFB10392.1 hypothetical protein SAMN04488072_10718 [Lentibacillus halodurans]